MIIFNVALALFPFFMEMQAQNKLNVASGFETREANVNDVEAMLAIYNEEVLCGNSNYEERPRGFEEQSQWLIRLQEQGYPVFVVLKKDKVVGFGALTPFHSLSGYRFTCSGLIYVDKNERRSGVGQQITKSLQEAAQRKNFHCLLAGVNSQNKACLGMLRQMGFVDAGHFKEIGFKNGEWQDDICLQYFCK